MYILRLLLSLEAITTRNDSKYTSNYTYMSVYLLNATSLAKPNAVQLLETELSVAQCDCALITETWFTKNHIDRVVDVPHYSLYRRDRQAGKGGSVCIYVSHRVNCSISHPCPDVPDRSPLLELLWIECSAYGHHYFVYCCYHPPRPKYVVNAFVNRLANDI